MSSRQLRETKNYVWDMNNVLGRGATSIVYMGQKKCTGEEVAVKVFTQPSDSRTLMIQQREFAVLKMLCHNNVVQLFAMEPEISGNMHVLVMQYCSEGTLYRMLSKPEHTFGLEEDEFLIFLRDITEGMKHLRDQLVHRDIKPGNILCYKADTGRFEVLSFTADKEERFAWKFSASTIINTSGVSLPDLHHRIKSLLSDMNINASMISAINSKLDPCKDCQIDSKTEIV